MTQIAKQVQPSVSNLFQAMKVVKLAHKKSNVVSLYGNDDDGPVGFKWYINITGFYGGKFYSVYFYKWADDQITNEVSSASDVSLESFLDGIGYRA